MIDRYEPLTCNYCSNFMGYLRGTDVVWENPYCSKRCVDKTQENRKGEYTVHNIDGEIDE